MTPVNFIHLHVHSEYSLCNGIVRLKKLVAAAAAAGMPAVAVTDQCNLFGMVKFYKAAQAAGIKPIIGADILMASAGEQTHPARLTLLCQNNEGYANLARLISRSYTERQPHTPPLIHKKWLHGATSGLIALGGKESDLGQVLLAGKQYLAEDLLAEYSALFPNCFYLELTRTGRPQDEEFVQAAVELALRMNVAVAASNDVHFLKGDDFDAHEARVCIHDGRTLDDPRRPRLFSDQQYLRTPQEMAELFADIPEAIENTVEIAKRCNVELRLGKSVLPDFPVPAGQSVADYFRYRAVTGLEQRLAVLLDPAAPDFTEQRAVYEQRLVRELDVIIEMGFSGYFLIVADFIQWAKDNGVPVGPGRGSGAGSLVAYALQITDLDPLRYELLFERFLNPERVSMPDFDIDFCMEGRDRVIDYVVQRYGRERVSQIITYGTMAAKAVVRDVGRALGFPYGFVDQIAKLIPFELGMTLEKALKQEDMLRTRYEKEDDVRTLIDLARSLEGLARNAGKHAGGVVIAPTALTDFTPLYCEDAGAGAVTQFDKDDVEAVGLVKFDFLGLRTLTIIDWAVKAINAVHATESAGPLDISRIPLEDKKTFDLLKDCATTAVFQLESRGMKDLIKRLQPDNFEEIVALVALFRPGPLQSGMVDDFINRKHGRTAVEYPHPDLAPILKPTYGVILYQEQVMQIAQVLAGYSLGSADLLRRAMGKKKAEEMAKQRATFVEGATSRGVKNEVAAYIFDLMEKFAGYGFNKSHSAAYALLSYQTAWLKAHYPAAFMAAVLSSDLDNTDKVVTLIEECRHMKLQVVAPDVNVCDFQFKAIDEKTILYGLGAVKGVGQAAIEAIVAERNAGGRYSNLYDFCGRIDLSKVNRRVLEALVRAGALDELGPNRASLFATFPEALQWAEQRTRNSVAGQDDLFAAFAPAASVARATGKVIEVPEWSQEERLQGERDTLGFYLTGHPLDRFEAEIKQFVTAPIAELRPNREQGVVMAGLVVALRTRLSRKGDRMAFVTLEDRTGRIELAAFPESYQRYRELLVKDQILVVEGVVAVDEFSGGFKVSADKVLSVEQAQLSYAKRLELVVDAQVSGADFTALLLQALTPACPGSCPVIIRYYQAQASVQLTLGPDWRVQPTEQLLQTLRAWLGPQYVRLILASPTLTSRPANAGHYANKKEQLTG